MSECLLYHDEVAVALREDRPVLALESTLIAHGLPFPRNLEVAQSLGRIARAAGAVPATVGLMDGRVRIGLSATELERLAQGEAVAKVSRRDLAATLAEKRDGATTVAATMICAALAGIRVFATGGIGGVHRDAATSFDVSADLDELARTPVAVIASGAKTILDLPRTLEALETRGVPVVGYGTDVFPGFYLRETGLPLEARVDGPEAAARLIRAQRDLGLATGLLIANPIPAPAALEPESLGRLVDQACAEAEQAGIAGKRLTPYLLKRLFEATGGRALEANVALIEDNVRVGAEIAVACHKQDTAAGGPTGAD